MPHYMAEFDHGGYEREHHEAANEQQVRDYYNLEMPWVLPVLITEIESDESQQ